MKQTLDSIIKKTNQDTKTSTVETVHATAEKINTLTTGTPKNAIFIQYRSKCTEEYSRSLHKANAPYSIIRKLRKLNTTLSFYETYY